MTLLKTTFPSRISQQRGLVLFFALVALVVLSLAAALLVRSVDTNTIISGNLAFRQAATSSADRGVEAAITALTATEAANIAKNVFTDTTHAFNISTPANGYYSNVDPALNLTASATWTDANSILVGTDASGNTVRFIIQRMCRDANTLLSTTNCLFSGPATDKDDKSVPLPSSICEGPGCPKAGQNAQYRVTARATGPKNSISYTQALVY